MRHRVAGYKLGRKKDDRAALRRNLVKQLFEHERIADHPHQGSGGARAG